ncbi:unnamed protein product [Rotaria sordida]|uniref:tRNA (guanine(37)-N1)-methyltransferase n=1 Tax=Rotaria sordida TaxID=392033 RepID=A0A814GVL2_9BILA|nr:unnamed protein product [Rotaria sordida]CAF3891037.1 unnamed protein product [Rotaria sordida]
MCRFSYKFIRSLRNMHIKLPLSLKGMTKLDREQFTQIITVPYVNIPVECIQTSKWKNSLLTLHLFKNVRDLQPISKTHKQVLFDPDIIKTKEDIVKIVPSIEKYVEKSFDFTSITLTYANYSIDQVIKAILPDDLGKDKPINTGSGYSLVGHIAHFNLKDAVLPYKHIIAQVVLDKLPNVKTVVNKLHEIDSVYRNFELEILAGEPNTIVKCRESKAIFQFDFAKVYWNPRLSTERERIVNILHHNDLVFDVFAGVGPFVVPALMLGCTVYGNDINPESFKWMTINLKNNQPKKSSNQYYVFNIDGREFLQTIVLPRIENYQQEIKNDNEKKWCLSNNKIVILMNLPEIALTFLDVLSEWLSTNIEEKEQWILPIHIYCYTFSKADNRDEDIRMRLKSILPIINDEQITCRFVRQVAPNKDMMCVRIILFNKKNTDEILSTEKTNNKDDEGEVPAKRFKQDSSE